MTTYNSESFLPNETRKKWIQRKADKLIFETFDYIHIMAGTKNKADNGMVLFVNIDVL